MNKAFSNIIILLSIACIQIGCDQCPDWPEEKKEEFAIQCLNKVEIEELEIQFHDFKFEEIDTIRILEKFDNIIIDSFNIYTKKPTLSSVNYYSQIVPIRFKIKNEYNFIIGNYNFKLENLFQEMQPEYTLCEKNYGCQLTKFKLNGKVLENYGFIPLRKNEAQQRLK